MKKIAPVLFKITVSSALLYFLFRGTDFHLFWRTLTSIQPVFLLAALLFYSLIQIFTAYRWFLLLQENRLKIPFPRLISLYFIGLFFNNLLPTAIGGDFVKAYYLYKLSGDGSRTLASVFMDRYSGFCTLVLISLLSLAIGYPYVRNTAIPFIILLLAAVFFGVSFFLWVQRLHNWALHWTGRIGAYRINERVESLYRAVMIYKGQPVLLLKVFGISLVTQIVGILVVYLLSRGYSFSVPIEQFFLFVPLAISISMIPISLAGLGLREGAFVFLFGLAGLNSNEALSLSLVWFLIILLVSLLGAVEYARLGSKREAL